MRRRPQYDSASFFFCNALGAQSAALRRVDTLASLGILAVIFLVRASRSSRFRAMVLRRLLLAQVGDDGFERGDDF
jgi:hypothetical protein